MLHQNWVKKTTPFIPDILKKHYPNPLVQIRLAEFGFQTLDEAETFLNPDQYQPTPPQALPDLAKAANRLWVAVQNKEKIGVWGDFDVDGQTSTTLLVESLQKLGAEVIYHIPNRDSESHGIRLPFLLDFLKQKIDLLLTCDTGVSEHESIHYAMQQGIDTIITDHHSLPETLPVAYSVVNPQRLEKTHPLHPLAGVGTAYKLIEAVYQLAGVGENCEQFLDLVALGTVADVALLQGDNRWLVQKGLQQLQNTSRLGLREIYKIKEINPADINESHISFILAPMLNSLGRLDDANPIVDFLTTTNPQFVNTFATQLNNLNEKRKLLTDQITDAVLDQMARNPALQQFSGIVVHQNYWHPGILGIVANRIVEQFQKPVILLTGEEKDGLRGSARSIESVNIIQAISEQQTLLDHFGGHAMAAGLSMPVKNLDKFRAGLNTSIQKQIGSDMLDNGFLYDYELDFKQITLQFLDQFLTLQPFGAGNPPFLFFSKAVKIQKISKIGKTQQHVRLHLTNENQERIEVLWWRGDVESLPNEEIDIIYTLNKSTYKGQERVQIELVTFRPSPKTINKNKQVLENLIIQDFRRTNQTVPLPNKEFPEAIIWYEGIQKLTVPSFTHLTIGPSKSLIIAFLPPGLNEIRKVIQTCRPQQVILYPPQNYPLVLNELMEAVGSMLKYAIQNKQGLIQIEKMAAAIGQRKKTVETALEYLAAAGKITLTKHPDTDTLVQDGGIKNEDLENYFLAQLKFLHKETRAFQTWYQSVNSNKLKEELFQIN